MSKFGLDDLSVNAYSYNRDGEKEFVDTYWVSKDLNIDAVAVVIAGVESVMAESTVVSRLDAILESFGFLAKYNQEPEPDLDSVVIGEML